MKLRIYFLGFIIYIIIIYFKKLLGSQTICYTIQCETMSTTEAQNTSVKTYKSTSLKENNSNVADKPKQCQTQGIGSISFFQVFFPSIISIEVIKFLILVN